MGLLGLNGRHSAVVECDLPLPRHEGVLEQRWSSEANEHMDDRRVEELSNSQCITHHRLSVHYEALVSELNA